MITSRKDAEFAFLAECQAARSDKVLFEYRVSPARTLRAYVEIKKLVLAIDPSYNAAVVGQRFIFGWDDGFYLGTVINTGRCPFSEELNCLASFDDNTTEWVRLQPDTLLKLDSLSSHHQDTTSVAGRWAYVAPADPEDPVQNVPTALPLPVQQDIADKFWVCPFVDAAFFNIRGLSMNGNERRKARVESAIKSLTGSHQIVMLSETNIKESELQLLHTRWGRTHRLFTSCGKNGRQGVLTMVESSLLQFFEVECIKIDYLDEPWLLGHMVILVMTHRMTKDRTLYVNMYIKSGANSNMQLLQLQSLANIVRREAANHNGKLFLICGGDLNNEPQTKSQFNTEWERFLEEHNASELPLASDGEKPFTFVIRRTDNYIYSHLDRVAIGGSDVDIICELFVQPTLRLADMAVSAASISDHRAISITFRRLQEGTKPNPKNIKYQAHAWLYKNAFFCDEIRKRFKEITSDSESNGATALRTSKLMKEALGAIAAETVKRFRRRIPNSLCKIRTLDSFILAVTRGDLILANRLAIKSETKALQSLMKDGNNAGAVSYARSLLASLVGKLEDEEANEPPDGGSQSATAVTYNSVEELLANSDSLDDPLFAFLHDREEESSLRKAPISRSIKDLIRVTRVRVHEVIDAAGIKHSSPDKVGKAVQKEWTRIYDWSSNNDASIGAYLKHMYRNADGSSSKVLKSPIARPDDIRLEDITRVIGTCKDKAAGPDGIPVMAYKVFSSEWAPVLLGIVRQLSEIGELPEDDARNFNVGTLICIPKKTESCNVNDLRGITIGNFDNRIVSAVIKNAIQPAFEDEDVISPRQYAFLSERLMTDAIMIVLCRFYQALQRGWKTHILQIDFAKAYDNVSRAFLFAVLQTWGLPEEYCRAIRRLHEHVRSHVWCAPELTIEVNRSIKQGDPLACLLILPVVQVLCDAVDKSGVDVEWIAFADDLTFIIRGNCDDRLKRIIDIIDEFGKMGSDFIVNHSKSTLLSTMSFDDNERKAFATCGWIIPRVGKSKILGIPFGCLITEQDIWEAKVEKIKARAEEFTKCNRLSPIKRMIYANTYLVPIVLFTAQLYPIPEWVASKVEEIVAKLVFPKTNSVPREFLYADSKFGGPPVKLREFVAEGKASILRVVTEMYQVCFKPVVDLMGGDIRFIEWHPWHPICSLAYVAYKEPTVFNAISNEVTAKREHGWKSVLNQRNMTKLLTQVDVRYERSKAITEEKARVWLNRLGLQVHEHEALLINLWTHLEEASRCKTLGRARWISTMLLFNALPTASRYSKMASRNEKEKKNSAPLEPNLSVRCDCALCGAPSDDVAHLFGGCSTIGYGVVLIAEWLDSMNAWRKSQEPTRKVKRASPKGSLTNGVVRGGGIARGTSKAAQCSLGTVEHLLLGSTPGFKVEELLLLNEVIWDVRCFYTFKGESVVAVVVIAEALLKGFKAAWKRLNGEGDGSKKASSVKKGELKAAKRKAQMKEKKVVSERESELFNHLPWPLKEGHLCNFCNGVERKVYLCAECNGLNLVPLVPSDLAPLWDKLPWYMFPKARKKYSLERGIRPCTKEIDCGLTECANPDRNCCNDRFPSEEYFGNCSPDRSIGYLCRKSASNSNTYTSTCTSSSTFTLTDSMVHSSNGGIFNVNSTIEGGGNTTSTSSTCINRGFLRTTPTTTTNTSTRPDVSTSVKSILSSQVQFPVGSLVSLVPF